MLFSITPNGNLRLELESHDFVTIQDLEDLDYSELAILEKLLEPTSTNGSYAYFNPSEYYALTSNTIGIVEIYTPDELTGFDLSVKQWVYEYAWCRNIIDALKQGVVIMQALE